MHPADHGHPRRAACAAAATTSRPCAHRRPSVRRGRRRTFTAEQVVFAAAALGTQKLLHRMQRRGPPARASPTGSASSPAPTPSRSSARSRRTATGRLQPRRRDHLVVPPRRGHPHRAGALRQGQQRDGPAADRAHRRRRRRTPRWRSLAARDVARSAATSPDLYDLRHWSERTVIALVMQTLDNSITTYAQARPAPAAAAHLASRATASRTRPGSRSANEAVRRMADVDRTAPPAARSASRSTCR